MGNNEEKPLESESIENEKKVQWGENTAQEEPLEVLYELPKKKTKKKRRLISPILFATFSAISIGLLLGMITLQMFVNLNQPSNRNVSSTQVVATEKHDVLIMIPSLSSFMLQAGVFAEKSNAENWQHDYEDNNFPTVIWERDGQWYLFIGIHSNEDKAKTAVKSIQEQGIDVFVKEWKTTASEVELTKNDAAWIDGLESLWQEALTEKNPELLKASLPELSELSQVVELAQIDSENNSEQYFLDWLLIYETLGK